MSSQQQTDNLKFQDGYNGQNNQPNSEVTLENKTTIDQEIQEIDDQIILLLSKRFNLSQYWFTAQEVEEDKQNSELGNLIDEKSDKNGGEASQKKKKSSKKQDPNKEEKKYQLSLIHKAKKLQIRRTLIRKIFRSIQQEVTYLKKQHPKKFKSLKESLHKTD